MRKSTAIPLFIFLFLIIGGLGYTIADIHDVVPGILTTKERAHHLDIEDITFSKVDFTQEPKVEDEGKIPDAAQVQQRINQLMKEIEEATKETPETSDDDIKPVFSIKIVDTKTGQELGSAGSDTSVIPASVNKLFSAATALKVLGPQARFETSCVLEGDTLYLVAGGDQLLARGAGRDGPAAIGYAGIKDLAIQCAAGLQERDVKNVQIRLDDTVYGGKVQLHPDWVEQDTTLYGGPIAPLAFDAGRNERGQWGFVDDPAMGVTAKFVEYLKAEGIAVGEVARGKAPQGSVQGVLGSGQLEPGKAKDSQPTDSASESTSSPSPSKKPVDIVASVKSGTVEEIVDHMLTVSDNVMAENMCWASAMKLGKEPTFENVIAAEHQVMQDIGVDISALKNVDCSGLSFNNHLDANTLVDLLQVVAHDEHGELKSLLYGLPIAGYTGTLVQKKQPKDFAGQFRAKTGSLSSVRSLAGYMRTDSGRTLTVVVVVNSDAYMHHAVTAPRTLEMAYDLAKM